MVRLSRPFYSSVKASATTGLFLLLASTAYAADAKTLGDMTNSFYDSLISLQTFLSMLSYILGVWFSITGLQSLRAYVDDPGRNPIQATLLRMGAAAFFIFAPTAANMLVNSLGGGNVGGGGLLNTRMQAGSTPSFDQNAGGLDQSLNRFVADFAGPFLENLLPFFCYVSGIVLMLIGLKRLALANGDGAQAPGGMGTMGTFLVAAALMSFGYIMFTLQGSIFGTSDMWSNPLLKVEGSGSAGAAMTERAQKTLWGVFIFLRIVGYISVLRGLFMLRAVAEGGQVSMMAVGTHMIAGALLANGTAFVYAVQKTFINNPNDYIFDPAGL